MSQPNRSDAQEDGFPADAQVSARAEALIERGLERYGTGDLLGALCDWEHALVLLPKSARASEYVQYVRENFEILDAEWRAAKEMAARAAAMGPPCPDMGEDVTDAYDLVEVAFEPPTPIPVRALAPAPAAVPQGDEGWDLEELTAPVRRPAPLPDAAEKSPIVTVLPAQSATGAPDLDLDFLPLDLAGQPEHPVGPAGDDEDPTKERSAISGGSFEDAGEDLFPDLEIGADFDDGTTSERRSEKAPESHGTDTAVASAPRPPAVIVDAALLHEEGADELETTNGRGIGIGGTPPEGAALSAKGREDRLRQRAGELLRLAREAAEREDYSAAIDAVEAVLAEDAEGVVAPVMLHRYRELLIRVYEGYIGGMTQVPLVAVPLHQIAAENLDHRTGFLLSRIDGLLSFDDILDVSGMPRLDAYRILARLLRRGFLEVR